MVDIGRHQGRAAERAERTSASGLPLSSSQRPAWARSGLQEDPWLTSAPGLNFRLTALAGASAVTPRADLNYRYNRPEWTAEARGFEKGARGRAAIDRTVVL